MRVLVATRNQGKLREIREILANSQIDVISLDDVQTIGDPVEDADSFIGNALKKAHYFAKQTALPTIADDSGLCVDVLNGAPGVLSARFAGQGTTDKKNNALLLKKLNEIPDEKRGAHFECAMVCVRPDGENLIATGRVYGRILHENRGENGFGYDPLFIVPDKKLTFAQLPPDQKHAISHRGQALRSLAEKLPAFLAQDLNAVK